MKIGTLLVILVLVWGCINVSFAAPSAKLIPLYPGSKINTETNLTEKDFLPVIRQWLLIMPEIMNSIAASSPDVVNAQKSNVHLNLLMSAFDKKSLKDLEVAISGLKSISVFDCNIPKDATQEKVSEFYLQKLGLSKNWTLTLRTESPVGTLRLYTKADFESFFGYIVAPGRITVFRTRGKVDLLAISKWMSRVIPLLISFSSSQTVNPQSSTVVEPIPIPLPLPETVPVPGPVQQ